LTGPINVKFRGNNSGLARRPKRRRVTHAAITIFSANLFAPIATKLGGARCIAGDDIRRGSAYLYRMGKAALIVVLVALLGAALWFASGALTIEGPDMPPGFYVAMWFGIVFSLIVGIGLMALIFYSSRRGYDEPPQIVDDGSDKNN